jgi:tetratricopeptide (TPR) repeat protein
MAWSRMLLGQAAYQESRYEDAKQHFREGLEGYLSVGARDGVGWAMIMMGLVSKIRGDYAGAAQMFLEALTIEEEVSNFGAQAWANVHLGESEWLLGHPEEAVARYRRAMEIYRRIGDHRGAAETMRKLGNVALGTGQVNEAESRYLESDQESHNTVDPLWRAWHAYHLALVTQRKGWPKEAEKTLQTAVDCFESANNSFGLAWSRHLKAELLLEEGEAAKAETAVLGSLEISRRLGLLPLTLENWLVWAGLLAHRGFYLEAVEWTEAVIQHPSCSKPTERKAVRLRDEWEIKLDAEERAFARRAATAADLDAWSDRILQKAASAISSTRTAKKPAVVRSRKPAKKPTSRRKK